MRDTKAGFDVCHVQDYLCSCIGGMLVVHPRSDSVAGYSGAKAETGRAQREITHGIPHQADELHYRRDHGQQCAAQLQ